MTTNKTYIAECGGFETTFKWDGTKAGLATCTIKVNPIDTGGTVHAIWLKDVNKVMTKLESMSD